MENSEEFANMHREIDAILGTPKSAASAANIDY